MRRTHWLGMFALLAVFAAAPPALPQVQQSRCADCHFARPGAPGARHLSDWDASAHGRNAVGCESCHGSEATTFESFQAHRGILHSSNPASPVARINLPATCGKCHEGPFAAFQRSRHYQLIRGGDRDAPTCVVCHDEVGAYLLSPKQLEGRCNGCHGAGRVAPNPDLPPEGRLMLEGIREARTLLQQANTLIRRVTNKDRRARLEAEARQAAVPLVQATDAGHAFVFDGLRERLDVARKRIADLYERLLNQ